MKRACLLLTVLILFAFGCGDDDRESSGATGEVSVRQVGDILTISNNILEISYDLARGFYSIKRRGRTAASEGTPVVENAFVEVRSFPIFPKTLFRSTDGYEASCTSEPESNPLGEGARVTVTLSGIAGKADIEQTFILLNGFSPLLTSASVVNRTGAEITVGAIAPAMAGGDVDGGLAIGERARDLRILENGFATYIDFYCRLIPGHHLSLSNWNTAVHDPASGESLVFGALTYENGEPIFSTTASRQPGYTLNLEAVNQLTPSIVVPDGGRIDSEMFYMDCAAQTAFDALENYADAVKAWQGIVLWTERHPEIGVPNGWNSWTGSGGSGGYGADIDEEIIMANLEVMDSELRKWGMNFFQVDDGWQIMEGDWQVNGSRFPDHGDENGIEWILGQAKERGFHPGLWINPYNAHICSQFVADHPDWLAKKDLIGIFAADENWELLDLTNPEVQLYLADLMGTLVDWGCEWIKQDFGYWFLMTHDWHEPNITRINAFRQGQQLIREALGPDVFFLTVSVMGPNYGLVDGDRIELDTMPVWEGEKPSSFGGLGELENYGVKPSVRTIERRYFLHQRIWVNHPDLIFFRAHADPQFPPLTLDESKALCQLVAYAGGIVKLGDKLVDMSPDAIAAVRTLLPIYGTSARPIDLFRREFAEIWSLAIPDFPEPYHALGLFNWGLNRDLTTTPFRGMEDIDHEIHVDFAEAGLEPSARYLAYEFWGERFLGEVTGSMTIDVPAHSALSVVLREKLGRPQFLGTNRHILGGVKVIYGLDWDEDAKTLSGTQEGSTGTAFAPFSHHLAFYVPDGYDFDEVAFDAPEGLAVEGIETELEAAAGAQIFHLRFTIEDTDGEQVAEQFGEIGWTCSFL